MADFRLTQTLELARRRIADRFMAMTLKARVVLLVLAMFVAGIWALAFSITLALERDLAQTLSTSISAETNNLASDLDRDLRLHIEVLKRLAASLGSRTLGDPVQLDRALDEFADSSVIVPAFCFFANKNGIITAGYPHNAVQVGSSVDTSGYFRAILSSGKPVIGEPITLRARLAEPAVPIAVPVRGADGTIVGALVGGVMLSDPLLFGQLEHARIGRTGWIIVISPKERLIVASTNPKRVMTRLPGHGVIPLLDRRLEEGYEGVGITMASIGVEVMTVTRKMKTTGWVVNSAVPTAEVYAPIASIKRQIYLVALLISLAVAAILRYFLVRQFVPLIHASAAMRRMTTGEMPLAAIPVVRRDEIGELIASFNLLVAERSRLEQSLQTEIVEHNRANDALRESRDRLEGIYQSVGDGIISIDVEQRITRFNGAAEQIFGYTAEQMIGQPLVALLPERFRQQHEQHIHNFDSTGQSRRTMGTYGLVYGQRSNGEEFPLEAAISQSGSGPVKLFTVILRDITERRRAEREREQLTLQLESLSQRLATAQEEERSRIAYELHEELGQELTTLKYYLQAAESGADTAKAGVAEKNALAVAAHATERVRRMVLDIQPPELADFGLHAALRSYCQRQAAAGRWNLHIDAPKPDVRAPQVVERACFRVLQESLKNVLHHARASEVRVCLKQQDDWLELRIRDNGIGFDRDQPDEDNGHKGGSLGLFGMQIRAKHAGGSVEIRSTPHSGTEVLARFPLRAASIEAELASAS